MAIKSKTTKSGEPRYVVRARDAEGVLRESWHVKLAEARRRERDLANERDAAKENRTIRATNPTLAQFTDEYLAAHVVKPQTLRALADRLLVVRRSLGSFKLRDLDRTIIGRWVNEELDEYAPTTQRAILKSLRQILRKAQMDGLIAKNPASEVKLPTLTRPPIRPFRSWAEIERLAERAGRWGPMIRFAAATGLRPQEWLVIKRGDLDLAARRLSVRRTRQNGTILEGQAKTKGSLRTIVLSHRAVDALEDSGLPDDPEAFIFTGPSGNPPDYHAWRSRQWYPALDAAKLERRGPKNLRHTFATLALQQDPPIPIQDVQRQLGHTDVGTTLDFYVAWMPAADERLLRLLDAAA